MVLLVKNVKNSYGLKATAWLAGALGVGGLCARMWELSLR